MSPTFRGALAFADVHGLTDADAHARVVEPWARSTWEAYAALHPLARAWIEEVGRCWGIAERTAFGQGMERPTLVADLEHELALDQVHAGARLAGDARRSQLGHPRVVETAGLEGAFDQVSGRGHARARLAGVDQDPEGG